MPDQPVLADWAQQVRPVPGRGGARRRSVSQSFLIDLFSTQLAEWQARTGRGTVSVVDIGGGTGGLAVALAGQGHAVTVIDPSPDALAALQRRAAETDLSDYISGRQGDTADLSRLVEPGSVDVVVCHRVLEVVEDPRQALGDIAAVLESGLLSLLVPQRYAAAVQLAVSGDFGAARRVWSDDRAFDADRVRALLVDSGYTLLAEHGVGVVSGQVSEQHVERPERFDELYALETDASADRSLVSAAPLLHVLAGRGL